MSLIFGWARTFLPISFSLTGRWLTVSLSSCRAISAYPVLQLNPHLLPPLTFTHSPTPAAPVRGSTPVAHTFVRHPSSGRDHMIITFWVHGRGRGEPEPLHWAKSSWHVVLGAVDDAARYCGFLQDRDSLFSKATTSETVSEVAAKGESDRDGQKKAEGSGGGWFGSMLGGFSGLRSPTSSSSRSDVAPRGLPPPGTYRVGEVKGDYVKVSSSYFLLWTKLMRRNLECRRSISAVVIDDRRPLFIRLLSRSGRCVLGARSRSRGFDIAYRR